MKQQILELKEQGLKNCEIAKKLNINKSTVTYHLNINYYGRNYYQDRQRDIKQQAVNYKGGKCQICGYNKCLSALEFHHLDPSKKDFSIGKILGYSLEILKKELEKCILICSNCHKEIHENISINKRGF